MFIRIFCQALKAFIWNDIFQKQCCRPDLGNICFWQDVWWLYLPYQLCHQPLQTSDSSFYIPAFCIQPVLSVKHQFSRLDGSHRYARCPKRHRNQQPCRALRRSTGNASKGFALFFPQLEKKVLFPANCYTGEPLPPPARGLAATRGGSAGEAAGLGRRGGRFGRGAAVVSGRGTRPRRGGARGGVWGWGGAALEWDAGSAGTRPQPAAGVRAERSPWARRGERSWGGGDTGAGRQAREGRGGRGAGGRERSALGEAGSCRRAALLGGKKGAKGVKRLSDGSGQAGGPQGPRPRRSCPGSGVGRESRRPQLLLGSPAALRCLPAPRPRPDSSGDGCPFGLSLLSSDWDGSEPSWLWVLG